MSQRLRVGQVWGWLLLKEEHFLILKVLEPGDPLLEGRSFRGPLAHGLCLDTGRLEVVSPNEEVPMNWAFIAGPT